MRIQLFSMETLSLPWVKVINRMALPSLDKLTKTKGFKALAAVARIQFSTKANSKMTNGAVTVVQSSPMERYTSVIGKMTKSTAKAPKCRRAVTENG